MPDAPENERQFLKKLLEYAGEQQLDATDFLGYEQVTLGAASTALTVPAGAVKAVVAVETAAVRYRLDGATTAPTASVGMPVPAGSTVGLVGALAAVRFIRVAAGAVLNVCYFG
jgi:hypothetical protein